MRFPWSARTSPPTPAPWRGPAQDTRDANAASIAAIPLSVLPDGPARRLLIAEAATGRDVYAYQATPHHTARWNIWYGPLAPRYDARIPAQTWAQYWPDLVAKAAAYAAAQEITQAQGGA